ncbi:hypothetical protein AAVH_08979 [Aphelenchoides avenae]|nr:hypothetical protein AAVH_08979 [Aphelenchus avenae]
MEASLRALGFLDRQTLDRARRLSATANRYRKILSYRRNGNSLCRAQQRATRSSSAAAECAFQHTLLDKKIKGTVTKRTCSNIGLPATNASLATPVGWNCSFDYVSKKAAVDFKAREMILGRHWITWFNLFVGVFDLVYAVRVLPTDRTIADDYMAAIHDPPRDRIRSEHEALRKGARLIANMSAEELKIVLESPRKTQLSEDVVRQLDDHYVKKTKVVKPKSSPLVEDDDLDTKGRMLHAYPTVSMTLRTMIIHVGVGLFQKR